MYNIREKSMTHGEFDVKKQILFSYNHLLYLKKMYKYYKEFNKDRNFLCHELKKIKMLLIRIKNFTNIYNLEIKNFCQEILEDNHSSIFLKILLLN